jgi:hypothetical protein
MKFLFIKLILVLRENIKSMKKRIIIILLALVILVFGVLIVRFIIGGDEDTWICERAPASAGGSGEAKWIMHGKPSSLMPSTPCTN